MPLDNALARGRFKTLGKNAPCGILLNTNALYNLLSLRWWLSWEDGGDEKQVVMRNR